MFAYISIYPVVFFFLTHRYQNQLCTQVSISWCSHWQQANRLAVILGQSCTLFPSRGVILSAKPILSWCYNYSVAKQKYFYFETRRVPPSFIPSSMGNIEDYFRKEFFWSMQYRYRTNLGINDFKTNLYSMTYWDMTTGNSRYMTNIDNYDTQTTQTSRPPRHFIQWSRDKSKQIFLNESLFND